MITINSKSFEKDMSNIINYSIGYLDGVQRGKVAFLKSLGQATIQLLKQYIDANARINPEMLHHVYEWNKTGSPDARLFDLDYTISGLGLSIKSSFRQSQSIKDGSNVPFYDKARIMENGIPVTIRPKNAKALVFDDNGVAVFSKGPIVVNNPGGENSVGGFESAFDSFFNRYFTQAFLISSGILSYLENPESFSKNMSIGKKRGRQAGIKAGYDWISNIGAEIE